MAPRLRPAHLRPSHDDHVDAVEHELAAQAFGYNSIMHILQIYKDYYPVIGGIENHVRDLSEGLVARGHRVTALVTSLTGRTEIEHPRSGLTLIKAARALHIASTPLSAGMLRLAGEQHPDVVHLHFPYPPGDLAARAVPGRPPLIVTYHSDIVRQRALLRVYRPLMQLTLRRATRILATSPNYLRSSPILRRFAAKCAVVPLGIDAERFAEADPARVAAIRARYSWTTVDDGRSTIDDRNPPSSIVHRLSSKGEPPLLLFVGRLRYYKGLHILLDALPQVPARLLIGGTGPERERLAAQAARLGIDDRVHFLGDVADTDLPALLHAADVFVLPAHLRAEALGLAQIEALAAGLSCVSTELGTGTSFANRHGETGLVVRPGDPAALGQAINMLLADVEMRRRFGAAGRRRVRALFTRERMLDGVERVYREAVIE
jgi:rhamnosyl/mannosyltransferase